MIFLAQWEQRTQSLSNCRCSGRPNLWFGSLKLRPSSKYGRLRQTKLSTTTCSQPWTMYQGTATRLLDLISNPPTDNKYKALRDRLVDTFGLSKQERASRLLHFRPLGDSKPSTLMDEMLSLLGDHPPCLLFVWSDFQKTSGFN